MAVLALWNSKDGGDTVDYGVDWSNFLDSDVTIETFSVTTDITVEFSNLDSTSRKVLFRVTGGVNGTSYPVTCDITVSTGESFTITAPLNVSTRKGY